MFKTDKRSCFFTLSTARLCSTLSLCGEVE